MEHKALASARSVINVCPAKHKENDDIFQELHVLHAEQLPVENHLERKAEPSNSIDLYGICEKYVVRY